MQTQVDIEKLKYPIGKFSAATGFNGDEVKNFIQALEILPSYLENAVKGLSPKELLYSYRPEGWNIKQIVHHVADSHLNFHIRLRLTLTEETPTVKPYNENAWAKLVDYNSDDIQSSLMIIKGVHKRTVEVLKNMDEKDFARQFHHPEHKKDFSLLWLTGLYAWHGKHHAEQIKTALEHKY